MSEAGNDASEEYKLEELEVCDSGDRDRDRDGEYHGDASREAPSLNDRRYLDGIPAIV